MTGRRHANWRRRILDEDVGSARLDFGIAGATAALAGLSLTPIDPFQENPSVTGYVLLAVGLALFIAAMWAGAHRLPTLVAGTFLSAGVTGWLLYAHVAHDPPPPFRATGFSLLSLCACIAVCIRVRGFDGTPTIRRPAMRHAFACMTCERAFMQVVAVPDVRCPGCDTPALWLWIESPDEDEIRGLDARSLVLRHAAEVRAHVLGGMRSYMDGGDVGYEERHVAECASILDRYERAIAAANDRAAADAAVRGAVVALNDLDRRTEGRLIETDQREGLCAFLTAWGLGHGFFSVDEDVTEAWRTW